MGKRGKKKMEGKEENMSDWAMTSSSCHIQQIREHAALHPSTPPHLHIIAAKRRREKAPVTATMDATHAHSKKSTRTRGKLTKQMQ